MPGKSTGGSEPYGYKPGAGISCRECCAPGTVRCLPRYEASSLSAAGVGSGFSAPGPYRNYCGRHAEEARRANPKWWFEAENRRLLAPE